MSKRKTTVKMCVTMSLPTGANAAQALEFVRDALTTELATARIPLRDNIPSEHTLAKMEQEDIKVSLLEKRVTYA